MTNKELIKIVASDLKLKPSKDIIDGLVKSWDFFEQSLEMINKLDTSDVSPFYSPNFSPINYLREDKYEKSDFDISVVLKNSHHVKNNYIVVKKVIK